MASEKAEDDDDLIFDCEGLQPKSTTQGSPSHGTTEPPNPNSSTYATMTASFGNPNAWDDLFDDYPATSALSGSAAFFMDPFVITEGSPLIPLNIPDGDLSPSSDECVADHRSRLDLGRR
jgi:hypothetical protein